MAASFTRKNPAQLDGLFLWAAYPAESDDLSGQEIKVVSIYGTLDGLMTSAEVEASRALLPADTTWTPIEAATMLSLAGTATSRR